MNSTKIKSTLKLVYDTASITKDRESLPEAIKGALNAGAHYLIGDGIMTTGMPILLDDYNVSVKIKEKQQDDADNVIHCTVEIDATFEGDDSIGEGADLSDHVSDENLINAVENVFNHMACNAMLTDFNDELLVDEWNANTEILSLNLKEPVNNVTPMKSALSM